MDNINIKYVSTDFKTISDVIRIIDKPIRENIIRLTEKINHNFNISKMMIKVEIEESVALEAMQLTSDDIQFITFFGIKMFLYDDVNEIGEILFLNAPDGNVFFRNGNEPKISKISSKSEIEYLGSAFDSLKSISARKLYIKTKGIEYDSSYFESFKTPNGFEPKIFNADYNKVFKELNEEDIFNNHKLKVSYLIGEKNYWTVTGVDKSHKNGIFMPITWGVEKGSFHILKDLKIINQNCDIEMFEDNSFKDIMKLSKIYNY